MPSFSTHGFLTVATAGGMKFRGTQSHGWRKAILLSDENELLSNNVPNTVEPILANIPLLIESNTVTLDGIGYELIWDSNEIQGTIYFNNPNNQILRSLEMACLELAISLTKQTDDHGLFGFVEEWKRYSQDRG